MTSLFGPPEGYPPELPCDRCEHRCDQHDGLGCLEPFCDCICFEPPYVDDSDMPQSKEEAEL